MENATDALKIAFAVIIFVLALTIAIYMFSELNQVSKIVLSSSDITNFYEYEIVENQTRNVGLETIIPTLYKYYKENYTVLFLQKDGKPLELYNSQTERRLWGGGVDLETEINSNAGVIAKYYTNNKNSYTNFYKNWDNLYDKRAVCAFDVDEETTRHEPWTGSESDFNKNLDCFFNGETFIYPSAEKNDDGTIKAYNYAEEIGRGGFIQKYSSTKFKEMLGEYTYSLTDDDNNSLLKNRKKRIIIYQIVE